MSGWPSAAQVAEAVGGRVRGDASRQLRRLATLDDAGPDDLSFLHRPDMREAAEASRAACVIVGREELLPGRTVIVAQDPYRAFALAVAFFHPEAQRAAGVSPLAAVDPSARVATSAHVAPFAVVARDAVVGERAAILEGAVVGESCEIGEDAVLHPRVVLYPRTVVGRRVVVHAGAVLGADGFGYSSGQDGHLKIRHVGRVVIEDDVEIGAATCVDRAVLGETRIGSGTKVDNLVQVGHNVVIGAESLLVAQSGVAGSTVLGRRTALAGQAGVAGHLTLGDGVMVGAKSAVLSDVEAGRTVSGIPAMPHATWKRVAVLLARIPELFTRLARLERAAGVSIHEEKDE